MKKGAEGNGKGDRNEEGRMLVIGLEEPCNRSKGQKLMRPVGRKSNGCSNL